MTIQCSGNKKKRFAFLIHARDTNDFWHLLGQKLGIDLNIFGRVFPESLTGLLWSILRFFCPVVVCSRFTVSPELEGVVIGLPMTAEEMLAMPPRHVSALIADAVAFAQERLKCGRVGLGAYTSPLSLNGKSVIKDPRITCAVTHGDALSAASAVQAVIQGAARKNLTLETSTIAVVGSYGIIGRAVAIMIADLQPARLILTGPNVQKLMRLAAEVPLPASRIVFSPNNSAVHEADIVVLCTTANGDVVRPKDLKRNAIVVDMAQPHNMTRKTCVDRPDVLRIDGGSMQTGVNPGFAMGLPMGATLACFTETMVLAMDDDKNHHVGPVDIAFARNIMQRAQDHGYDLAPLTCFGEPL